MLGSEGFRILSQGVVGLIDPHFPLRPGREPRYPREEQKAPGETSGLGVQSEQ